MYEIIYKKNAENKIKSFIKSYKNIFLETFTDTWLFYEDIIRENYINNSDIINSEIYFKVPLSWVKDNNYDKEMIVLARYNQEWEYLKTEIYNEDENFTYYKAISEGFSYFSILVKEKINMLVEELELNQTINMQEQNQEQSNIIQNQEIDEPYNLQKTLLFIFLFMVVCLISALVLYFFLTNSGKN